MGAKNGKCLGPPDRKIKEEMKNYRFLAHPEAIFRQAYFFELYHSRWAPGVVDRLKN